jgi:hypothetical protein
MLVIIISSLIRSLYKIHLISLYPVDIAFFVAITVLAGINTPVDVWAARPRLFMTLIGYIPFMVTNIAATGLIFYKAWYGFETLEIRYADMENSNQPGYIAKRSIRPYAQAALLK